jgi:hypothetical protein
MPLRACKKDDSHKEISPQVKKLGVTTVDLSCLGNGAPDEVWIFQGKTCWIEYKTGKGKLRQKQIKWQTNHPGIKVSVIKTFDEALLLLGLYPQR